MEPNLPTPLALIITALPVEYAAVRAYLGAPQEVEDLTGGVYEVGTVCGWNVALAEVGAGNPNAAAAVERAVLHFEPTVAIFVGVAGGLKDVQLGDVVAAIKVYGYERGKETSDGFCARPDVAKCSHRLVERAKAEARSGAWSAGLGIDPGPKHRAIVGPIAAGEKVVADARSETAALIREHYGDAVAVEMEGIGFLTALHAHPNVQSLIVRGISDLLSGKSTADAEGGQEVASRNAAAFAVRILGKLAASRRASPGAESTGRDVVEQAVRVTPALGTPSMVPQIQALGPKALQPAATSPDARLRRIPRDRLVDPGFLTVFEDSPTLAAAVQGVLRSRDFPRTMAIDGRMVPNPVWTMTNSLQTARPPVKDRLRGHMLLIVADDPVAHPRLYCYRAETWNAFLLPFYKHPEPTAAPEASPLELFQRHVAARYGSHAVPTGRTIVSVKRNEQHPDELWLYAFEFYSMVVPPSFQAPKNHAWFDLERLSAPEHREVQVNGDVARAIKSSFGIGLHDLARSPIPPPPNDEA